MLAPDDANPRSGGWGTKGWLQQHQQEIVPKLRVAFQVCGTRVYKTILFIIKFIISRYFDCCENILPEMISLPRCLSLSSSLWEGHGPKWIRFGRRQDIIRNVKRQCRRRRPSESRPRSPCQCAFIICGARHHLIFPRPQRQRRTVPSSCVGFAGYSSRDDIQ